VYQVQPGAVIPDFRSFGILWMARTPLARAFDMDGAFNTVALSLSRGAVAEDVIDRMDALLDRYGGLGAYSRKDQTSHRYLSEEFRQLEQMATMFPAIFLSVAAFLLNVVVTRLIATQRDQVAILKAFGYSNLAIVAHYLKLVALMVCVGVAAGIGFGVWLAQGLSNMYMEFYRFPYMLYELRPQVALTAGLISAGAAMVGTVFSVMRAALLPPAEAMQPPPPAKYRKSLVERTWIGRMLDQPTRMIIRNVERRPLKSVLSVLGIGAACAILLVGGFFSDSADHMLNIQFKLAQTYDLSVTFTEPTSRRALYSLASMEGVHRAEPFRSVPVRLKHEHRSYRDRIAGH
jgi:putative ABC transport system permease protein